VSWQALAWASKCRTNSAAEKLMLLAYAECHNEESGWAYPSIAWLCEFSSLNRKTVITAVARLEQAGLLTDSGERKGRTKQLKVYTVNVGKEYLKRNSSETGTVPKTDAKQSQKRDTEPLTEPSSPTIATQSTESVREEVDQLSPVHVVEAWNATAQELGLPSIRGPLSPERRRKLKARIRDHPLDDWRDAFAAIGRSAFLRGETGNWRGATFDFLLSPTNFQKVIEGNYDPAR
jgi:hypothetical protein